MNQQWYEEATFVVIEKVVAINAEGESKRRVALVDAKIYRSGVPVGDVQSRNGMTDVGTDAAMPKAQDILAEAKALLQNGKSIDDPNVGK